MNEKDAGLLRALLASGAAGALYGFAQVGFGIWPLVLVCLAGLWLATKRVGVRGAAVAGALFGFVAHAVAMGWLLPTISRFAGGVDGFGPGALLWTLHGLWVALGFAIATGVTRALRDLGVPWICAGPSILVLVEWLQPVVFSAGVGVALIHAAPLAQLAELGGPLGLTLFVAGINAGLAGAIDATSPRARVRAIAGTGLALVAATTWGSARIATWSERASEGVPLRVGVVQANVSRATDGSDAEEAHARLLEGSRALQGAGPLDLIVWPETAYPRALPRPLPIDASFLRADVTGPILLGANSVVIHANRRAATNSVFLVEATGEITQAYDKQRLIPLAEHVPFWAPSELVERGLPGARSFVPGPAHDVLRLGEHRIATPICFEVADASAVRGAVLDGDATLIVTVADDAWFGRSQEPAMHLDLARLRAIEQRRWLVRATNTGYSAIIDPTGRAIARTPLFESATLRERVFSLDARPPFARFGNGVAVVLALLALALGVGGRGRSRSGAGSRERIPEREDHPSA